MKKTSLFGLICIIAAFIACSGNNQYVEKKNSSDSTQMVNAALDFINAYVQNANKMNEAKGTVEWINASDLVTQHFKNELSALMRDASSKDPELGPGADPLFNAQDYPDKGFELEAFDPRTNYLTVKGKDWKAFTLTIKAVKEKGKWLVDGCGVINIPESKRAKR